MQDLGKERVEERVTGVDEVEAMRDEFSLRHPGKANVVVDALSRKSSNFIAHW